MFIVKDKPHPTFKRDDDNIIYTATVPLGKVSAWSYFFKWLVLQGGKMNKIMCCDSLPKQARWSYLACSGSLRIKLMLSRSASCYRLKKKICLLGA